MKFKIPFTFSDYKKLRRKSDYFLKRIKHKSKTKLGENLKNSNISLTREEYLSIVMRSFFISFLGLLVFSTTVLAFLRVGFFYLFGLVIAILFSGFIVFSQLVYPRIYVSRRQKDIERNLLPALEDMLIQVNSGVPLFSVMVNISSSDYGQLSVEFKKAVKRINAGESEKEVLEDLGENNPSVFFRRTLWQISNGMNAGSDMAIVISDSIHALHEEQLIQIQNYGNKLNPLIMFYMLISVILPALAITFITILSSILGLEGRMIQFVFIGLFIMVMLMQVMFLGLIKSRRPSLL